MQLISDEAMTAAQIAARQLVQVEQAMPENASIEQRLRLASAATRLADAVSRAQYVPVRLSSQEEQSGAESPA